MSFALPAAAAALVALLPLLAFYLVAQRPRRKRISAWLLWAQPAQTTAATQHWRRLRRWLSLLLQWLMALLLAFALMQPWLGQPGGVAPLLVAVDVSPSMGALQPDGRTALAVAAEQAAAAARAHGGEVAVLAAGTEPRPVFRASGRAGLAEALTALRPEAEAGDGAAATALAEALRAASPGAAGLWLTDGVGPAPPAGWAVRRVGPVGEGAAPPANAGVTHFSARRPAATPGEVFVAAEVAANRAGPVRLRLERSGRLVDAREVTLVPGVPWRYTWRQTGEASADYALTLTPDGSDALAADNAAAVAVPAFARTRVFLGGEPSVFLETALRALPGADRVERPVDADLAVWHRPAEPLPAPDAGALLLLDPLAPVAGASRVGEVPAAALTDPLAPPVWLRRVRWEGLVVRGFTEWAPPPGALVYGRALAPADDSAEGRLPVVWGRWDAGGPRWLVVQAGLAGGELPLRTAFPLLLSELAQSLRGGSETAAATLPGLAETLLEPTVPPAPPGDGGGVAAGGGAPVWPWLLALAVAWCLLEWQSFHRRWTE